MNSGKIDQIVIELSCRDQIVKTISGIICEGEILPPAVYAFGQSGTGKSAVVKEILAEPASKTKFVILNCIECYTNRILYERILCAFIPSSDSRFHNRCETFNEFVDLLLLLDSDLSYVIIFDNAERLRDMEFNILPTILRLQEITSLNICCILISQLPFEKYYTKTGLSDVIPLYFIQYSKADILQILLIDFPSVKSFLIKRLEENGIAKQSTFFKQSEIIASLSQEFYRNYLNLFLSVFYKACRDLPELKTVSKSCFEIYIQPILDGVIESSDLSRLWRHIVNPLRVALSKIYMRIDHSKEVRSDVSFDADLSVRNIAYSLELPYYGKYLLIAGFLASHNSTKEDKRLFVKHHGKQRKRQQDVNAKAKTCDKMSTALGPKSFSIDRLLAIFYAILEEKVGLTCNLLAQISTLVHLKLLSYASGENNVMEGSARLQCAIGLEFILYIGKSLEFNVRQYLCDFM